MENFWRDVCHGVRVLKRVPWFTTIAVVTLAIGIGANTLMFSVADLLLFRSMQSRDSGQPVCCGVRDPAYGGIRHSAYVTIRDRNPVFGDLMAQDDGLGCVTLAHREWTKSVCAAFVSSNYFTFLGSVPLHGRGFLPGEEQQGVAHVVVLSYRIWQQLGGDPEIVGQPVRINGVPCLAVGVMPETFTGLTLVGPDLWLPLGHWLSTNCLARGRTVSGREGSDLSYPRSLVLVGRLKPDLDMSVAQAQLQVLNTQLRQDNPRQWRSTSTLYLYPAPRVIVAGGENERTGMALVSSILMGVSAVVLLIVCLNLSAMISVQGAARHKEIAVRMAVGGGHLRILRQLLTESLVLALAGGFFGLLLAFWGTKVISMWIGNLQVAELSRSPEVVLSVRALGSAFGFCLIAMVLFGLRPALNLLRRDVVRDLRESGGGTLTLARRRRARVFVSCQIALAVMLVMGATMFVRSALQLAQPNPGFNMDNKLVIEIDPLSACHDRLRSARLCESLADRLENLPGVEALGLSRSFSFGGGGSASICEYTVSGKSTERRRLLASYAARFDVGREYFAAMELPLLSGRSFNRLDGTPDAEKVVIIDESLARRLRPDGNALGCLIQYESFSEYSEPYRVVGIVPNMQCPSDSKVISAQTYGPIGHGEMAPYIYVRTAGSRPVTVLKQLFAECIRQTEPEMPILSVATLAEIIQNDPFVWFGRFWAKLAVASGAMALFLAALGIYAVKRHMVTTRTPEIGVRKALGATDREIIGMVLREGLLPTLVGIFAGLLLGFCLVRIVAGALYGISVVDPLSILVAITALGIASVLAAYFPACQAAKVDPMVSLRYE